MGFDKFDQNKIIPLRGEISKNSNEKSENIEPEISVSKGGLSVDTNIIPKCPSGPTSSSLISLPTETPVDKFRTSSSHKKQTVLSPQSRAEIHWWIYNLKLNDGKSLYENPLIW